VRLSLFIYILLSCIRPIRNLSFLSSLQFKLVCLISGNNFVTVIDCRETVATTRLNYTAAATAKAYLYGVFTVGIAGTIARTWQPALVHQSSAANRNVASMASGVAAIDFVVSWQSLTCGTRRAVDDGAVLFLSFKRRRHENNNARRGTATSLHGCHRANYSA